MEVQGQRVVQEAETLESLAVLERTLRTAPEAAPSLTPEQVETRVDRVIALMARSAYDEAARASEALWREGVRDVRLVSPSLFGAFLTHGPRSLPTILSALQQVFTGGWEQLGPEETKSTLADSGLLWLFKSLHKHLEFHGRAQDDVWRKWGEGCAQSHLQEALQHASTLLTTLEQRLPKGGGPPRLLQVTRWLSEHRELFPETEDRPVQEPVLEQENAPVKEEPAPVVALLADEVRAEEEEEDPEEEDPEEEDGAREDTEPVDEEENVRLEVPAAPRRRSPFPPRQEPSPALEHLMHKLAAFDHLVARQDFSRASMVAADVLQVIDHFDPLVYLPSLFSGFLAGLSAHAEQLEPRMQGSRSFGDRALERLYRTDLAAFLNSSTAEDTP